MILTIVIQSRKLFLTLVLIALLLFQFALIEYHYLNEVFVTEKTDVIYDTNMAGIAANNEDLCESFKRCYLSLIDIALRYGEGIDIFFNYQGYHIGGKTEIVIYPNIWVWGCFHLVFPPDYQYWNDHWLSTSNWNSLTIL